MTTNSKVGKSYWFDLPVVDVVDARSFYEGLFDWKFLLMNNSPVPNYWVIQAGDELIGGIRKMDGVAPGSNGALLYFTVDNLSVASNRVKELGGKLVGDVVDLGENRGAYQWFKDREGNLVALWAPSKESL